MGAVRIKPQGLMGTLQGQQTEERGIDSVSGKVPRSNAEPFISQEERRMVFQPGENMHRYSQVLFPATYSEPYITLPIHSLPGPNSPALLNWESEIYNYEKNT